MMQSVQHTYFLHNRWKSSLDGNVFLEKIDIIKWVALTALNNQDTESNAQTLWREVEQE